MPNYAKWLSDFTQSRSAAEKVKVVDPYTARDSSRFRALERKARRSGRGRRPAIAVRVWVDAHMRVLDYDEARRELRLEWLPTGGPSPLPPFRRSPTFQERTGRTIGNFDSFAKLRAPKDQPTKLVMRVLQDLTARPRPARATTPSEGLSPCSLPGHPFEARHLARRRGPRRRVNRRTFMLKNRRGFNKGSASASTISAVEADALRLGDPPREQGPLPVVQNSAGRRTRSW